MTAPDERQVHPPDIPAGEEYYYIAEFVYVGDTSESRTATPDELNARADQIAEAYPDNPRILTELMEFRLDCLIAWEEQVPALYAAIARWPNIPAIRMMLVSRLVAMKRYAEAELVLQPLIEKQCVDALDTVYDLALTHHLAGRHRDGLRLLDACRRIAPEIELNPSFAKVQRVADELKHLTVPFDAGKRFRHDRALRGIPWTMAALGVLSVLMLIGLGIGSIYLGYHAGVYVVNGLDRDYTVTLNGTPFALPAHGVRKLDLAEDDIRVAVPNLPAIAPAIAQVHSSFFTRLRQPVIFVINPDGGAILEETVPLHPEYGFAHSEKHRRYIAGKTLLKFGQIDLPFEGLPFKDSVDHQLKLQTRLTLLQQRYGFSLERFLPNVAGELPRSDLNAILHAQATLSAHPQEWQAALSAATRPATQPR